MRKADLALKHSPSVSTPPTKSTPPKPKLTKATPTASKKSSPAVKAGTKRKKRSSQTESDYEDEEFKVRERERERNRGRE